MKAVTTKAEVIELLKLPGAIAWVDVHGTGEFQAGQPSGKHAAVADESEAFETLNDIVGDKSVIAFIPDMAVLRRIEHDGLRQQEIPLNAKATKRRRQVSRTRQAQESG